MSSRERFGRGYMEAELQKIADHLQTEVEAYLIGGGAMALHQPSLKDTTKDIDLVVVDETALSRLMGVLDELAGTRLIGDPIGAEGKARHDEGRVDGVEFHFRHARERATVTRVKPRIVGTPWIRRYRSVPIVPARVDVVTTQACGLRRNAPRDAR